MLIHLQPAISYLISKYIFGYFCPSPVTAATHSFQTQTWSRGKWKKPSWPWLSCAAGPRPCVWRWSGGCHWRRSHPAWLWCSGWSWSVWRPGTDWCPLPPTAPLSWAARRHRRGINSLENEKQQREGWRDERGNYDTWRTRLILVQGREERRERARGGQWRDWSIVINSWWPFRAAYLRQGSGHGRFPSHAVPDEDALLDVQLGEEVLQIAGHRLVGQHRAVRAVAMVTRVYRQHLTGQRTVSTLGMGKNERHKLWCFATVLRFRRGEEQRNAVVCSAMSFKGKISNVSVSVQQ